MIFVNLSGKGGSAAMGAVPATAPVTIGPNDRLPFELRIPGSWIDFPDADASWNIRTQLRLIETALMEATMAVLSFDQAAGGRTYSADDWESESERRYELSRQIEAEMSAKGPVSFEQRGEIDLEVKRRMIREKWDKGLTPVDVRDRLPFIHAKAYLSACDQVSKLFGVIKTFTCVGPATIAACDQLATAFPKLLGVRNSTQHVEDRVRGLGKDRKPLKLQPVDAGGIKATGGTLVIDHLAGNCYGNTTADGHYGEVEVSLASLGRLRDCIEAVFASLPWMGPADVVPR